jgi:hypothetical protein
MAGAGYRNWTAGDVPTATQFDTYIQEQTVMVFASTAARDTALSVPKSEGMYAYAVDINTLHFYNGAAWEIVHEPIQTWNVTNITQNGSRSCTTTRGWYQRSHGVWRAQLSLTITAAGSSGTGISVATPFTLASSHDVGGSFEYTRTVAGTSYVGTVIPLTTTTMQFRTHVAPSTLGVDPTPFATANTDLFRITAQGTY